jgi:hypothetical protein
MFKFHGFHQQAMLPSLVLLACPRLLSDRACHSQSNPTGREAPPSGSLRPLHGLLLAEKKILAEKNFLKIHSLVFF